MKNNLLKYSLTAFVLFVAAAVCPAQEPPMVGGYKETSKTDETVVAAANFAVETQARKDAALKLVGVKRAARQVVAGFNYEMCLAVTSGNQPREATAIVYHDLENNFSLTSWTNGKCAAGAEENAALEALMKKFIRSIETKNTDVFLSFVSPAKGLTVMNTIDQGEAGNSEKPMLDAKFEYKKLAADFKKRGAHYRDIFLPSPASPNFHDGFAKRQEKWTLVAGDKFQIVDAETGEPSNAFYVKWEKTGARWFVTEVGRMIS